MSSPKESYFYNKLTFKKKDIAILEAIKNTLGVGNISYRSDSAVTYKVKSKK